MSTTQDTTKWPQWLKNAITENADVEIGSYGSVIWRGGVWCDGEWRGGVWRDGVWRGGVWRDGEWCGGVWRDGEWRGGVWCDGEWRGGVWCDGVWCGGVWRDGVRGDFFDVLLRVPHEVDGLIETMKAGKVDGSVYEGDCACLCGTIANLRHCNYQEIPGLKPDSLRPIEQFFAAIRPGHTPENNPWCKQAVEWAEEFKTLIAAVRA